MLQIISRVKVSQIAQWAKLLTPSRSYGHEFEFQTCIFFLFFFLFFFFVVVVGFLFFLLFSLIGVYALHDPRISRDSQVSNIFFTKNACCQFTFNGNIIGHFRKWDEK